MPIPFNATNIYPTPVKCELLCWVLWGYEARAVEGNHRTASPLIGLVSSWEKWLYFIFFFNYKIDCGYVNHVRNQEKWIPLQPNLICASLIFQNGNITELLLKEGFARCVDWSIAVYTRGAEKLRAAER